MGERKIWLPKLASVLLILFLVTLFFPRESLGSVQPGLTLTGMDNSDATHSAFVAQFIAWLQDETGMQLAVASNGHVTIVNQNPPGVVKKPSLKNTLIAIIQSSKLVGLNLGDFKKILFDAFGGDGHGKVDMKDLAALPDPPAPPAVSNDFCKAQVIAHILDEYFRAAKIDNGANGYGDSHIYGIISENDARKDDGGLGRRPYYGRPFVEWTVVGQALHMIIHWFGPDPNDPMKMVEVYREDWTTNNEGYNLVGPPARTVNPPNPRRISIPILPWLRDFLKFIGRIISIGNVSESVWSGFTVCYQPVTYQVLSVLEGDYTSSYIIVDHPIINGSTDADPINVQLSSNVFYDGNTLLVQANSTGSTDPTSGIPIYDGVSSVMNPPAPVGGYAVSINKPNASSDAYILYTMSVTATAISVAVLKKSHRARKTKNKSFEINKTT